MIDMPRWYLTYARAISNGLPCFDWTRRWDVWLQSGSVDDQYWGEERWWGNRIPLNHYTCPQRISLRYGQTVHGTKFYHHAMMMEDCCLEIKLHTWRNMLLVKDSGVKVATVGKHQVLWAWRTVSKGLSTSKTSRSLPFNILRIFSVLCSCPTSTI